MLVTGVYSDNVAAAVIEGGYCAQPIGLASSAAEVPDFLDQRPRQRIDDQQERFVTAAFEAVANDVDPTPLAIVAGRVADAADYTGLKYVAKLIASTQYPQEGCPKERNAARYA